MSNSHSHDRKALGILVENAQEQPENLFLAFVTRKEDGRAMTGSVARATADLVG